MNVRFSESLAVWEKAVSVFTRHRKRRGEIFVKQACLPHPRKPHNSGISFHEISGIALHYNVVILCPMAELRFEWDESKDAVNQNKHGVSFDEAATVFADELARLIPDPDHSTEEERYILLGMSRNFRLLIVSHCERGADLIRIISARKADRQERKEYEGFINA